MPQSGRKDYAFDTDCGSKGPEKHCVVTDFGPVKPGVRKGFCEERPLGEDFDVYCTSWICGQKGLDYRCFMRVEDDALKWFFTTCSAFLNRRDGGPGPNCELKPNPNDDLSVGLNNCSKKCYSKRPTGTNGVKYCNICKLAKASCYSKFSFHLDESKPYAF